MIIDGHNTVGEVRSFLMIGQSNMAGRGEFNEVPKIDNENCFTLRNGRWQKMSEPINPDRPIFEGKFHSGISLGASFANAVAKKLNCKVGLIPCADGGTDMDDWVSSGVLYRHAVFMTKLAMERSVFSGIIWHQGESDCSSEKKAKEHKQKFVEMITALRKDLGICDVPVIIGELSNNYSDSWGFNDRQKIINAGYKEIAKTLKNCAVASANGLELKDDGIHFNSKALREFGERYFDAYIDLVGERSNANCNRF